MNQNDIVSMISYNTTNIHIISNKDRLTDCRSSRWWYDLSYAKEATNRNDIVSMIGYVFTTNWHIIITQTETDLQTVQVADDDMI